MPRTLSKEEKRCLVCVKIERRVSVEQITIRAKESCLQNNSRIASLWQVIVVATLSGGVLNLRGDDLGNFVGVTQPSANTILVTGVGTTINGQSQSVAFNGVRSIVADLRGGDDTLGISKNAAVYNQVLAENAKSSPAVPMYANSERLVLSGGVQVFGGSGSDAFAIVGSLGGNILFGDGNRRRSSRYCIIFRWG